MNFDIISGSTTGSSHVIAGKPNQDAVVVLRGPASIVAVVADGCSEGPLSQVGAHLGARITAERLAHEARFPGGARWESVRYDVRRHLGDVLDAMGGGHCDPETRRALVNQYLLFTLVAVVITPALTEIAAIGDGFAAVNGEPIPIGPFPGNMPPYLAYAFTRSTIPPGLLRWNIVASLPTAEVESFVIGTDGMVDFAEAAQRPIPGRGTPLGELSQLWTDPRLYRNTDALRRLLCCANGGIGPRSGQGGLLPDDTTAVVGRRIP